MGLSAIGYQKLWWLIIIFPIKLYIYVSKKKHGDTPFSEPFFPGKLTTADVEKSRGKPWDFHRGTHGHSTFRRFLAAKELLLVSKPSEKVETDRD